MTTSIRTRWAAIGAAVAVTLGAGGLGIAQATSDSGDGPVSAFFPIEPCRLADTRPAPNTVGPRTSPLGPDETETFGGWGSIGDCTLPNDTTGLSLNVTAVGATQQTNLRFFPADADVPTAANLNPTPGAPPTPNAVNVALSPTGEFSIFNKFGSVAVVVDVVGYYDDHTHDDRYYTEAESDAAIAAALAAQPWKVHVSPAEMHHDAYNNGGGVAAEFWPNITFGSGTSAIGMAFNDGVFDRVYYGFRLPDTYVAGTDVEVDMYWIPVSGFGLPVFPCEAVFWANNPAVSRAGEAVFRVGTSWETPNGFDASQTRLPVIEDLFDEGIVSASTMTIDGANLQPGDQLNTTLNRDGDEVQDTCEGMMVTGLVIHEAD